MGPATGARSEPIQEGPQRGKLGEGSSLAGRVVWCPAERKVLDQPSRPGLCFIPEFGSPFLFLVERFQASSAT